VDEADKILSAIMNRLVSRAQMSAGDEEQQQPDRSPVALVKPGYEPLPESELLSEKDRVFSAIAALLLNIEPDKRKKGYNKEMLLAAVAEIDQLVHKQVNEVLHHEEFQKLESVWRGLDDLASNVNFKADVAIDILDVSKDELFEDFQNNSADIFCSALFNKVYVKEYDQYGGRPYGVLLGMYDFSNTPDDRFWLSSIGKIAAASHAPFIGSVAPEFFGRKTAAEVVALNQLEEYVNLARYGEWHKFRQSEEACYVGLTFPRYILRRPWNPETNPVRNFHFTEQAQGDPRKYLWGRVSWLLARNLARSFEQTGWCQHIRGPKGGGLINGLPVDTYTVDDREEAMLPIEAVIPDYRELQFAKLGFIPLVYRKATSEAAFFSVQSAKLAPPLKDPKDAENAQMVCNLAYTFSVTRIAHYIKSIMRDNIGSQADAAYIQASLTGWISNYVTTVVNTDDFTLRRYPFKAAVINVEPKPGRLGWYKCTASVLPHIQFEGMDVELRLESRLG
jgi:type VI secretion system protein ImpC